MRFQGQDAIALFNNDVSQLKNTEHALRRQNQLFDNILQNVPVRIFWLDVNGNYIGANQNFLDDLKLSDVSDLQGKTDLDLPWPSGQGHNYFRQDMQVLKEGHSLLQMEDAFIDDDGNIQIWLISKLPLRDNQNKIIGMLGTYQDISTNRQLEIQLKEQAQTLQHQAYHDALTQLPNRVFLNQKIEQAIMLAERNQSQFALLFIDLDHFKQINDSLGHDIGDQVLQSMAKRLNANLRSADTLARLGGDEFTVIQTPMRHERDAIALAQKLIKATAEPILIGEHTFYLSNSIGISIYPRDASSAESLLRAADAAMYRAKDLGRNNYQFYTSELTEQAFAHLSMQTQIRQGIDRNEFIPYFQPQIDSRNGQIIGMEVLARWQDHAGKIISPAEFIHIAEKTGLIIQLDRQVMRKAIQSFLGWHLDSLVSGKLSLNLAVKQLEQDDFFDFVNELLQDLGCNPNWLEFEITESDIMSNLEEMSRKMGQLRLLGIKISIDDFGTGYSSLSYLKKFPVSKLKIDQSFIRDLPKDEDDAIITKTIISMADNLGLEVIAEGVETIEQQHFLQENGCHQIQGYLYSKPLDSQAMQTYLLNFQKTDHLTPEPKQA
ncbi:diguanylate cyclase [uncultured Thiomicrorhabdus sp.]